jgi:hypothetical protein
MAMLCCAPGLPVSAANFSLGVTSALAALAAVGSGKVSGLAVVAAVVSIGAELAGLANKLPSW